MNDDVQKTVSSGSVSPGTLLREARESIGLSVNDVSSLLHISEEYVLALEHEQYNVLPAPIYVKGYIRNYAKLVQIDSDELVQGYEQQSTTPGTEKEKAEELVSLAPTLPKSVDLQWLGFGALILILLVMFMTISTDKKESDIESDERAAVQTDSPVQSGALEVDGENGINDNLVASGETGKTNQYNEAIDPVGKEMIDSEWGSIGESSAATGLADTSILGNPSLSPADEAMGALVVEEQVAGTDTVFMFFSGECWVSVKDAYDLEIYAALKKSGESLELTGVAPFRVLLGDAAVVNLNFNGKNIALKRYTRKDSGTALVRLTP